jgi:hypothetical protein
MFMKERSLTKEQSVLIPEVKEKLLALKKQKDINCVWIPAYMGIVVSKMAVASAEGSFGTGKKFST